MAHARQRARNGDSMTTRQPIGATPKCAVGCRSRTGLMVRSSRSTSFGRSPRLVPRSGRSLRAAEGAEAVGEGSPLPLALRAGVALSQPQKLICWGPGGALAGRWFLRIKLLMGPRMSGLNSRH